MAGWIKIYKDLADHWLAQHPEKLGWWVLLLLKVAHEDKKVLIGNQLVELKRGQIIASLTFLAELWQTSKRTAERFVELLEKEQMLSRCVSRKVSIITICNYESYQEKKKGKCANECADDAPMTRQSVSEIKNIKEDKEIYNTPTAHTYVSEQDFINRYRAEGMWQDACLVLHIKSVDDCQHLFDRWIIEYQHNGDTHQSYADFKKHFIQWARITISKEKSQINGNANRQDKRRGIQVVANSPEDYKGAF